jgi:hypothetical protein
MELHRLKPMKAGYDEKLFNKLYKETEDLRRSLVYQIDPRRFGVSSDIIKSWFDDKFIFVFNRYFGEYDEGRLKGYLINSLKTFKLRILRKAYSKYNIHPNEVRLDDDYGLINIIPIESEISESDLFLEMALSFLKEKLSLDAYTLLQLELNPPLYITSKMDNPKTKIPAKLIAEYFELSPDKDSISFINMLRGEIETSVNLARSYFSTGLSPA